MSTRQCLCKHTKLRSFSPPKESRVLQVSADDLPQLRLASHWTAESFSWDPPIEVHEWNLSLHHMKFVTVDLRSQSMFREPCDAIRIYLVSIAQATKWATIKPPVFAQQATSLQMAKVRQVAFACYHHPRGRPRFGQRITGTQVETFSECKTVQISKESFTHHLVWELPRLHCVTKFWKVWKLLPPNPDLPVIPACVI